jgi:hypothetical protein
MLQSTATRRGRPKGSGIDDRNRLRQIAVLLAENPHLRPTTAIRRLGEEDPSVIRRLRDKFHALQGELMREVRGLSEPAPAILLQQQQQPAAPSEVGGLEARVAALAVPADVRRSATVAAEPTGIARDAAPAAAPAPTVGSDLAPYNALVGLAIRAAVSALEHQVAICEQVLKVPAVAAIMRQQIALSEMMMNLAWQASRVRPQAAPS